MWLWEHVGNFPTGGRMARILVVDDSESVYLFVRRELAVEEHVVDRLLAFTELAAYLRAHEPDLILLDLEMPALSGTAFARFLRRLERAPTRILIHSSLPAADLEAAAKQVGAVGSLEKSADGERLRRAIRRHLSTSPKVEAV
jgi:DNA-binding response OmpR family regulator